MSTGGVAGGGARSEQTTSPSTMAGHYRRLEAAIADALLAPSCRPFKTAGVRHERNVKFYTGWSPWVYSNFLSPNELHDSGYHSLSRKPFGETPAKAPQAGSRREEVAGIRQRFPSKIPVIVERYAKERNLPLLDKTKFLVPEELTMSQFVSIVRNRLQISACQSFYLLVNNRSMANLSKTLADVYAEFHDEDGFLYITYASQEMFGL
ncbi:microtubule-associated protein 1 light chain 3 alpha-like [Dermacentor variabilis]|uniref:microtubule-associated protein 1 light chain 3 alpha-like n=1 Tax=Dermacentor variabilis TaxID=34621 RepID=UPI003F5B4788